MGPDPIWGRRHLLLGRQILCCSTINEINGSPNCVIFCFVGRQLPNVENHWSTQYQCFTIVEKPWNRSYLKNSLLYTIISGVVLLWSSVLLSLRHFIMLQTLKLNFENRKTKQESLVGLISDELYIFGITFCETITCRIKPKVGDCSVKWNLDFFTTAKGEKFRSFHQLNVSRGFDYKISHSGPD